MVRILSIALAVLAAGSGLLPAQCCLLQMAGRCCEQPHSIATDCDDHDHDALDDSHSACVQISTTQPHQYVKISADGIRLIPQHAPVIDLRQDHAPLWLTSAQALLHDHGIEKNTFDRRSYLHPLDSPLFLIVHSFLI